MDWLDEDYGLDGGEADRTIGSAETSMHPIQWRIPGYSHIHASFDTQTLYGVNAQGLLVEIPRDLWMTKEQYKEWMASA